MPEGPGSITFRGVSLEVSLKQLANESLIELANKLPPSSSFKFLRLNMVLPKSSNPLQPIESSELFSSSHSSPSISLLSKPILFFFFVVFLFVGVFGGLHEVFLLLGLTPVLVFNIFVPLLGIVFFYAYYDMILFLRGPFNYFESEILLFLLLPLPLLDFFADYIFEFYLDLELNSS